MYIRRKVFSDTGYGYQPVEEVSSLEDRMFSELQERLYAKISKEEKEALQKAWKKLSAKAQKEYGSFNKYVQAQTGGIWNTVKKPFVGAGKWIKNNPKTAAAIALGTAALGGGAAYLKSRSNDEEQNFEDRAFSELQERFYAKVSKEEREALQKAWKKLSAKAQKEYGSFNKYVQAQTGGVWNTVKKPFVGAGKWIKNNPKTAAAIALGTAALGGGAAYLKHRSNNEEQGFDDEY